MKHIFIVNPVAGVRNRTEEIIEKVKKVLKEDEYIIHQTTDENDAARYVRNYLEENKEEQVRFYACGGDGTLNNVVNGAVGYKNAEVTCYPMGSGNDFLRYFGDLNDFISLEDLVNGDIINCDVIKYNDKYCINIFNIGFDGAVVVSQRKIKKFPLISGQFAYFLGVVANVFKRLNYKVKLTVDGKIIYEGKSALCAMANGKCYGGGFYCAPSADINDGLIDVCLIKKVSIFQFASFLGDYKKGTYITNPKARKYFEVCQGKHVELEIEKPLYYANDGETGKDDKVVLNIVNNAIKFVIPRK